MRVAFLGPAAGYEPELQSACEFLNTEARAERIVYLGQDDVFAQVEEHWRSHSTPPGRDSIWQRTAFCTDAAPDAIQSAVHAEHARLKVQRLSSIPPKSSERISLSPRHLLLACHDREVLSEPDVNEATVIVFGNSVTPQVKQFGPRFFFSPGSFAHGGLLLVSTGESQLDVSVYNKNHSLIAKHRMSTPTRATLPPTTGSTMPPPSLRETQAPLRG